MKTESHTVSKAPSQGKGEELKKDFLLALFEPQLYFVRTLLFYSLFGCVGHSNVFALFPTPICILQTVAIIGIRHTSHVWPYSHHSQAY